MAVSNFIRILFLYLAFTAVYASFDYDGYKIKVDLDELRNKFNDLFGKIEDTIAIKTPLRRDFLSLLERHKEINHALIKEQIENEIRLKSLRMRLENVAINLNRTVAHALTTVASYQSRLEEIVDRVKGKTESNMLLAKNNALRKVDHIEEFSIRSQDGPTPNCLTNVFAEIEELIRISLEDVQWCLDDTTNSFSISVLSILCDVNTAFENLDLVLGILEGCSLVTDQTDAEYCMDPLTLEMEIASSKLVAQIMTLLLSIARQFNTLSHKATECGFYAENSVGVHLPGIIGDLLGCTK